MGVQLSNESTIHSLIPNFNDYFLTKKIYAFSSECDNLRLADPIEFSQTFLNLKQFKFSSRDAIRKVVMFSVFAFML